MINGTATVESTIRQEIARYDKDVYARFGNVGVFCPDMEGHQVWSKELPPHATRAGWGIASARFLPANESRQRASATCSAGRTVVTIAAEAETPIRLNRLPKRSRPTRDKRAA